MQNEIPYFFQREYKEPTKEHLEYLELLKNYENVFGIPFGLPYPPPCGGIFKDDRKLIKKCLEEGKTVKELFPGLWKYEDDWLV